MEAQPSSSPNKRLEKKGFFTGVSDAVIKSALTIIIISLVFNWMANYDNPPERDDFSDFNDPNDAYQNALDEHQDKIRGFEGVYSLTSSVGVVMLVGGLFYKTVDNTNHLPEWARAAMVLGVLYFMIRLFTTELSLFDSIELLALINS